MAPLPIRTVVAPAVLDGTTNGKLPARILVATPGQAGGATVTLVAPAARAWRALCAAAKAAGHVLKTAAPNSSYRDYADQERIFLQRFTTKPVSSTRRWWRSQWWHLKPGYALAAVPGTSNHGRALAVDTGEEEDGDTGVESIDDETVAWLVANEQRFGFSHEVPSEPWHIRYFAGDQIPQAVLDYEKSLKPPAPQEDLMLRIATVRGEPTPRGDQPNVAEKYRVLSATDKSGNEFDVEAWHLTEDEYGVWRYVGLDEDPDVVSAKTWHGLGIPVHGGSFAQAGR